MDSLCYKFPLADVLRHLFERIKENLEKLSQRGDFSCSQPKVTKRAKIKEGRRALAGGCALTVSQVLKFVCSNFY